MKKILKWFLLIMGFIVGIIPISVFSPILFLLSVAAFWYFTKNKPNEKYSKYAKNGAIVSAIGFVFLIYALNTDSEPEVDTLAEHEELVVNADETNEEVVEEEQRKQEIEEERRKEEAEKRVAEREEKLLKQKEARTRKREEREEEQRISEANPNKTKTTEAPTEAISVPEGQEDVKVNDNIPYFSNEDITSTEVYHKNGALDSLGRVTAANAVVGVDIMPAEERGNIGDHEPTGWNQASYANIGSGGWLYNRSHLIGHQLTGNDDYANLMTGTRWFNMRMLEYENFVAHYIETTENHVRYRVTPVFEGNNLVASGAYIEGFSIEDNGEGLMFNIYIPNIQPGVTINYADGSSIGPAGPSQEGEVAQYNPGNSSNSSSGGSSSETKPAPTPEPKASPSNPYVDENGNGLIKGSNSKIYHVPGSEYYNRTTNPAQMFKSIEEAKAAGYRAPK